MSPKAWLQLSISSWTWDLSWELGKWKLISELNLTFHTWNMKYVKLILQLDVPSKSRWRRSWSRRDRCHPKHDLRSHPDVEVVVRVGLWVSWSFILGVGFDVPYVEHELQVVDQVVDQVWRWSWSWSRRRQHQHIYWKWRGGELSNWMLLVIPGIAFSTSAV